MMELEICCSDKSRQYQKETGVKLRGFYGADAGCNGEIAERWTIRSLASSLRAHEVIVGSLRDLEKLLPLYHTD